MRCRSNVTADPALNMLAAVEDGAFLDLDVRARLSWEEDDEDDKEDIDKKTSKEHFFRFLSLWRKILGDGGGAGRSRKRRGCVPSNKVIAR